MSKRITGRPQDTQDRTASTGTKAKTTSAKKQQKLATATVPAEDLFDRSVKSAKAFTEKVKTTASNLGRSVAASGVGQMTKAYLEAVARRAKVWGGMQEQTAALIRPLVDHTGTLDFSNFKRRTFKEFCDFLIAQARLNDNHSFRSPYADLLSDPKYRPLLEFLYQQSNKNYVLNAPAHFIEILLREFTAKLIDIDADSLDWNCHLHIAVE